MSFYLKNSDKYYLKSDSWQQERNYIYGVSGQLINLEEANKKFPYEIILTGVNLNSNTLIKPRLTKDYNYYCIPYELGENIKGITPEQIISNLMNNNTEGSIFVASTDPMYGCFAELPYIDENLIWNFSSPHLNTPFIIFNNKKNIFTLIDYDFPLQIIGYNDKIFDKDRYIADNIGEEGWESVFSRYASYTNMPYIFNEYYRYLLPEGVVKKLKLT